MSPMLLYRVGPEGFFAATTPEGDLRVLYSDPFETLPGGWEFGRSVDAETMVPLAPVLAGKIVGVGRSFAEHAAELGHQAPAEPILFLKSPSSIIGPQAPIVLPPESERVEFEGEIAVIVRERLHRADADGARHAILGVTCACDVTARDLQQKDPTFARAKSFDTFCPLGPAVLVDPPLDNLEILTRINGEGRQEGHVAQMSWTIPELLAYASRMMTLERGDILLTGTPPGVGSLSDGDVVEVEVPGLGVLRNPVEPWRRG
jgi:2-keto-4-pentenoate hydratase/2-oxohepta-3-ene-1,7-dioic acid hydratase in catechol pathway